MMFISGSSIFNIGLWYREFIIGTFSFRYSALTFTHYDKMHNECIKYVVNIVNFGIVNLLAYLLNFKFFCENMTAIGRLNRLQKH